MGRMGRKRSMEVGIQIEMLVDLKYTYHPDRPHHLTASIKNK